MDYITFWCVLMVLVYCAKTKIPQRETQKLFLDAAKEVYLEVNARRTKYMLASQNERQNVIVEIGFGNIAWIHFAQDRDRWRALVNTVMNLRIP
jgi:tRNA G46 methylase TrmB